MSRVYYCNDINKSMEFAKVCITQLDALNIANHAGFIDEIGREWTLSRYKPQHIPQHIPQYKPQHKPQENRIEIKIQCRKVYDETIKKFVTKEAHVFPLRQYLDRISADHYHVIKMKEWCVAVKKTNTESI